MLEPSIDGRDRRNRHYSLAVAFGYVTFVLGIGVLIEWLAAPANQTESINIWFTPLLVVFMLATAVTAVAARFRPRRATDPAQ